MTSGDGRWTLVMNGEIYNHRRLRADLVGSGHRLRGTSDTEVILELIAARGLRAALDAADGILRTALHSLTLSAETWKKTGALPAHAAPLFVIADSGFCLDCRHIKARNIISNPRPGRQFLHGQPGRPG